MLSDAAIVLLQYPDAKGIYVFEDEPVAEFATKYGTEQMRLEVPRKIVKATSNAIFERMEKEIFFRGILGDTAYEYLEIRSWTTKTDKQLIKLKLENLLKEMG